DSWLSPGRVNRPAAERSDSPGAGSEGEVRLRQGHQAVGTTEHGLAVAAGADQYALHVEVRTAQLGLVEAGFTAAGSQRILGPGGGLQPERSQQYIGAVLQIVHRGGTDFLRVLSGNSQHMGGQLAPFGQTRANRLDQMGQLGTP